MRRTLNRIGLAIAVVLLAAVVAGAVTFIARKPGLTAQAEPDRHRSRAETRPSKKEQQKEHRGAVVVAAGDVACDPQAPTFNGGLGTSNTCRQSYTAELVERLEPDAVLVLGDDQYDDGSYEDYLRSYDRTWGRFKRISHPTPGDPEDGSSLQGYYRYWGSRAGARGRPWYSFTVGTWHVVSLSSNCSQVGGCGPRSPQLEWLRADLAANRGTCQLAFWHRPRFSSTEQTRAVQMKPIWAVLSHFGVELVLNGEAHNYERFRPQDEDGRLRPDATREFIVGTGGKSLVGFTNRSAGSERRNSTTFGVLRLSLRERSYAWRFVPLPGGTFEDAGSSSCH